MSFEIGPLSNLQPGAAGPRITRGDFSAELSQAAERVDRAELSVPAAPPPDVRAEVAAAAERAAELWNDDRELNFRKDDAGRIVIEIRDRAGTVLRTIPPSAALAVMAGASL